MKRRTLLKGLAASASLSLGMRSTYLRAQSGPLRIGVSYALSGVGAPVGTQFMKGTEIAAMQVNRDGGLLGRQIELVVRDDKYNSAESVAVARELAGAGINLLIGGSQTVTALGLAPLAPELNAVVIIAGAAGMPVTHELFNRNIFRTVANNYTQYSSFGRSLIETHPQVKTWISIAPDGDFGRDSALFFGNAVKKYAPGKDATVLDTIFTQGTATDFRTQINALMSSRAEGLYIGVAGAAQISFFQQARGVGLYDKFRVIGEVGNGEVTGKAMGRNTYPNLWSISYWNNDLEPFKSNPLSQQLYKDYVESTGNKFPPALVMAGQRSAMALFEGVRKAKSSQTDAVIAAMEELTFDTPGGPCSFRKEDHQMIATSYYSQMGPSDTDPFYKILQMAQIDTSQMIEPATPGVKFDIKDLPQ
ncbi:MULTISPECIES: ABC transporter substrate-binding protein [unclassified Chelatococcus]|uniref:ABC transporter substrate-binding protein n=1 Tax=unclassified Chelatococcus TaxID=2638111 RepID=UPI001BCEA2A1|nr:MULTISPECIES: ABC transporter substrate-binding protein [unclassified Chelatococcus]CAH1652317.1 Leucine-, isoleucine-, valine-, threonine-, and alanine-binding protein [Hyphomicrobiales bacterium]MBS7743050.1 ABC transporter substrate-binding protein [Chelatococcus sp. HY11]MBX3541832.1 ABC transporter substrate-binding protein [Chelatococcus sp.]MCO5074277.1 ABC transporter substrate-binding protein [Chelatococcus sp.]CAH1693778.1 Leucine-, isoleucine-, valine-, threonine-, and alanine-bi